MLRDLLCRQEFPVSEPLGPKYLSGASQITTQKLNITSKWPRFIINWLLHFKLTHIPYLHSAMWQYLFSVWHTHLFALDPQGGFICQNTNKISHNISKSCMQIEQRAPELCLQSSVLQWASQ